MVSEGSMGANHQYAAQDHSRRILSIDAMRGLIIIFMMLDHIKERFALHIPILDPMDITATSPGMYFSRYLAHLCAPMFVFLTGLSAWLYAHPANKAFRSPTGFLAKRGLFLIFLELTAVYLVWAGSISTIFLQVIWAIGLCMLALSVLSKLNYWLIGVLGFTIVVGHNLLSPVHFTPDEWGYNLWTLLHDRGYLTDTGPVTIRVSYPVLPWIGVILVGYFAGPLYAHARSPENRKKLLLASGLGCYVLLALLRGFNLYGESLPWHPQQTLVLTVMAFFNFTKYPPSLDFLLITIGTGLLLLRLFESIENPFTRALTVFGSAPMFIYLLHLYVILLIYSIFYLIFGANQGDRFGVDSYYFIWAFAIILPIVLYKPTKWFAHYKHREKHTKPWLTYF
ncbi:heparan-alpha-glucosaminide N-acetyltransferase domain-containing protein [Rheinheimera sp.]|uniref:DUF1624 domain-containing protein n=1 Tax=Rheinheimera sp. TaxID=1869214 RepID=UPI00307D5F38